MAKTGFWPVGTLSGSPWQGSVKRYRHGATDEAVALGDVVMLTTNTGNANAAIAGSVNIIGVCVGIEPTPAPDLGVGNLGTGQVDLDVGGKYIANAAVGFVHVVTAPDALYRAYAANGSLTIAEIGENVDLIAGSNSTAGVSGHVFDAGNPTQATQQFRVIDYDRTIDNTITGANAAWIVRINENHFRATLGA